MQLCSLQDKLTDGWWIQIMFFLLLEGTHKARDDQSPNLSLRVLHRLTSDCCTGLCRPGRAHEVPSGFFGIADVFALYALAGEAHWNTASFTLFHSVATSQFHDLQANILNDDLPDKEIEVANIDVDMYEATLVALYKIAPRMVLGVVILLEDMTWWAEGWNGDRICASFDVLVVLSPWHWWIWTAGPKASNPALWKLTPTVPARWLQPHFTGALAALDQFLESCGCKFRRGESHGVTPLIFFWISKSSPSSVQFFECVCKLESLLWVEKKSSCFVFKVWNGLGLHQSLCARGSNVDSHPSLKSLRWSKSGFPTRWNNLPTNHTSNCTTEYWSGRTL